VDGYYIKASGTILLLGVTFGRRMTTKQHNLLVAAAVNQRASLIARMAHHIERGPYLWQLAMGLVGAKFNHLLAAVAAQRLDAAYGV
jgi:hypothetical protein